MILSTRFEQALTYAAILHSGQVKNETAIPYISHLLMVTGIALEHGADEDEAIAALLHDAVEDQGGKGRLADIRGRFGERVATIVEGCTDTDVTPKPEWNERKRQYIAHLRQEQNPSVLLVSRLGQAGEHAFDSWRLPSNRRGRVEAFQRRPRRNALVLPHIDVSVPGEDADLATGTGARPRGVRSGRARLAR